MVSSEMSSTETKTSVTREKTTQGVAAAGLAAGLLASSCCLVPLLLVSAGIGGAWMSRLTALSPYQPLFLGMAAATLGWGFWRSYRRDCASGELCANPGRVRIARLFLWLGATAALAASSIDVLGLLIL